MAELNKGGSVSGRVVNYDGTTFTVRLKGKGHELDGTEVKLSRTLWRGPGAVIGGNHPPYGPKDPRCAPRPGDEVIYNADLMAELNKPKA